MKTPIEQQIRDYQNNDFKNFSSNLLIRIKATHILLILLLLINAFFFTSESISIVIQLIMAVLVGLHDYDDNKLKTALTEHSIQTLKLTEVATKDYLTQIPNRRCFSQTGDKFFHLSVRDKTDFTILFIDIDLFKKINDDLGHNIGDEILRLIATTLQQSIRKSDLLARIGGEEFAILLPNTDITNGLMISENIRKIIEKTKYIHECNDIFMTISIGIAQRGKLDSTLDDMLKRSDLALYKAKELGRNRSVTEQQL